MDNLEFDINTEESNSFSSEDYWRRIFKNNPNFSSWNTPKQSQVKNEILNKLNQGKKPLRILDYGIGNMGLYRCFENSLLNRIQLTGISQSQQHDENDKLIRNFQIKILIGKDLSPFSEILSESNDYIISSYVFAYLEKNRHAKLLEEFCRVLVPNGELILVLHHPDGRRNKKFKLSETYWTKTLELYTQLIYGNYNTAKINLDSIQKYLYDTFSDDVKYKNYLESYIKVGVKFLEHYYTHTVKDCTILENALFDFKSMIQLVKREFTMTYKSFQPIKNPKTDIVLPPRLLFSQLIECFDPTDQTPIANFFTAVKLAN
jgi:SAM-dependent methyltransferase